MLSTTLVSSFLALSFSALGVDAVYNPKLNNNIALYWGQNSPHGKQNTLLSHCKNPNVDIIPVAFVTGLHGKGNAPIINLSDQCWSVPFNGTELFRCDAVAEDIKTCQTVYKKKILLSIGGSTYKEGGWGRPINAINDANMIWKTFGNSTNKKNRPFGDAVFDGFDLDLESSAIGNIPAFAQQLRTLMDADKSRQYMLTAAPQCMHPDILIDAVQKVSFDALFIQFYNNPTCSVRTWVKGKAQYNDGHAGFNMQYWQTWARKYSFNKNVKLFVGMVAGEETPLDYISSWRASQIAMDSRRFANFGGIMLWQAAYANQNAGYIPALKKAMNSPISKRSDMAPEVVTRHHHHLRRGSW